MRRLPHGFLLLVLLCWSGAVRGETPCPIAGQQPATIVQLFFGQSSPAGPVSLRSWQRFVADTVTRLLPHGFTTYTAEGHWRDPESGLIRREPSKVIVAAAESGPALHQAIEEIAAAYRRRFDQRTVGVITSPGCAAF